MGAKQRFIADHFRISQESTDKGWTMPYLHRHAAYEIYILESGERTVTIEDLEYTAKAKDATLFCPNIAHKSKGSTPFSGICIHFSDRYLGLYFTAEAKRQLMGCFRHKVIHLSDADFSTIKNIADHFTETAAGNFLALASVLDILSRSAHWADTGVPAENDAKAKKSQKIMEYTAENYTYIKRISDLTGLFHVSENYVFQIFRKNYGMTPKQYINQLRIKNACHRLKYTDKSIKSIAYDCGFDSYEYFINVFKKAVGCTPSEYKECFASFPSQDELS